MKTGFVPRSQILFGNAFPQRSALYTSDMTRSVMEGIPKRSLGTRNAERHGRHSQTEFGNEKNASAWEREKKLSFVGCISDSVMHHSYFLPRFDCFLCMTLRLYTLPELRLYTLPELMFYLMKPVFPPNLSITTRIIYNKG